MTIVVDSSIAVGWAFPVEENALADVVMGMLDSGEDALCPALWLFEVANALAVAVRRERLSVDAGLGVATRLRALGALVTIADISIAEALGPISDLARVHGLTAYDASYLHLAIRDSAPLATVDVDLRRAAAEAGVVLIG